MEDPCRGLLPRYHDGELSPDAARSVERHLAGCAACRAELLALHSLSATLAEVPAPAPGLDAEEFWRALQPRLGTQCAALPWRSWLPGLLLWLLQALLGLLGALLLVATFLRGFVAIGLPGLPLPGLLSTGLFGWAGVLYLVWLAAWWPRCQAEPHRSTA